MNSWILSIIGIVCLSVIVDIFIPEGETNKYIKGIFSLLIVFVVISPLPKLLNGNFDFQNILNSAETDIDLNFIASINQQKCDALSKNINNSLKQKDIQVNNIDITCNVFQENFEILNIYVDISNLNNKNAKKIKTDIIKSIEENININKEKIIFNE